MDNLKGIGFSDELIDKLIEKETIVPIRYMNDNIDNTRSILAMIIDYGIQDVNQYILLYTGLFYQDYNKINEILSKTNMEEFKNKVKLEEDYLANYIFDNLK